MFVTGKATGPHTRKKTCEKFYVPFSRQIKGAFSKLSCYPRKGKDKNG